MLETYRCDTSHEKEDLISFTLRTMSSYHAAEIGVESPALIARASTRKGKRMMSDMGDGIVELQASVQKLMQTVTSALTAWRSLGRIPASHAHGYSRNRFTHATVYGI